MSMYALFIALAATACSCTSLQPEITCRMPDARAPTVGGGERRYIDMEVTSLGGFGNVLLSFTPLYIYAMLSGRDFIIQDNTHFASFCRILNCGVTLTSEAIKLNPSLANMRPVTSVLYDIKQYYDNDAGAVQKLQAPLVRGAMRSIQYGGWYIYITDKNMGAAVGNCISKLTNCDAKNFRCVNLFVMQRLFPGGFSDMSAVRNRAHIFGLSFNELQSYISPPHNQSSRLSLAVHIRAQEKSIESSSEVEVLSDENKGYIDVLLRNITYQLFEEAQDSGLPLYGSHSSRPDIVPTVFVTSDNTLMKEALVSRLTKNPIHLRVRPIYVNSTKLVHTKFILNFEGDRDSAAMDTVIDWYMLSKCDILLACRLLGSKLPRPMFSSFAATAVSVGGFDRTKIYDAGSPGIFHRFVWY